MAPESISDFLLLRVFLVLVAVVSAGVALADSAAGAAAPLSAAAFLLLRVFLVAAGSLAAVLADSVAACRPFCSSSCWSFSLPFRCRLKCRAGRFVPAESAFLLFFDFFLAVVDVEVSAAADWSADALASFFVLFLFLLGGCGGRLVVGGTRLGHGPWRKSRSAQKTCRARPSTY